MKSSMKLDCKEVWREISSYLDADIDPELREEMERHFAHCRHCSAVLDGARNVIILSADQRTFTLPAGFSQRLHKKLHDYFAELPAKAQWV